MRSGLLESHIKVMMIIGLVILAPLAMASSPVATLKPVGSASLRWGFLPIYESTLYTPDGRYEDIQPGVALTILYRRNIRVTQLIDTTRDQWRRMDLYRAQDSDRWLETLTGLWRDVRKGDTLTLVVNSALGADFYLNDVRLGGIPDAAFTRDFLAIWLSPETRFPDHRARLLGAS